MEEKVKRKGNASESKARRRVAFGGESEMVGFNSGAERTRQRFERIEGGREIRKCQLNVSTFW